MRVSHCIDCPFMSEKFPSLSLISLGILLHSLSKLERCSKKLFFLNFAFGVSGAGWYTV